jgi:hypothetical protein
MKSFSLDMFDLHRRRCPECGQHHKKLCVEGWRLFHDTAWIIARTPDKKRAKA